MCVPSEDKCVLNVSPDDDDDDEINADGRWPGVVRVASESPKGFGTS